MRPWHTHLLYSSRRRILSRKSKAASHCQCFIMQVVFICNSRLPWLTAYLLFIQALQTDMGKWSAMRVTVVQDAWRLIFYLANCGADNCHRMLVALAFKWKALGILDDHSSSVHQSLTPRQEDLKSLSSRISMSKSLHEAAVDHFSKTKQKRTPKEKETDGKYVAEADSSVRMETLWRSWEVSTGASLSRLAISEHTPPDDLGFPAFVGSAGPKAVSKLANESANGGGPSGAAGGPHPKEKDTEGGQGQASAVDNPEGIFISGYSNATAQLTTSILQARPKMCLLRTKSKVIYTVLSNRSQK